MIRINLLPFRAARRKENIRRQVSVFVLSLILVVLIMFVVLMRLNSEIHNKREELASRQREAKLLQEQAKEVDKIKRELSNLEKKLSILSSLEENRRLSVELFESLTEDIIPNRMWLVSYKNNFDRLLLSGLAMDDKAVADFMTNLEKNGFFTSVSLESVRHQQQGEVSLRAFSLVCQHKKKS